VQRWALTLNDSFLLYPKLKAILNTATASESAYPSIALRIASYTTIDIEGLFGLSS
jgi:hypothetical protein